MRRALAGILILAIGSPARATVPASRQEPASAADQYQALVQSIRSEGIEFRSATTDSERRAAVEHLHVVAQREHRGRVVLLDFWSEF
jgi:hypothetical protein